MLDPDFLEPERLRAFVAVAETGSFSRAAEQLRLAQPTVSIQIRRLEEVLGHVLLDRKMTGASLTKAGEMMLGYARELLEVMQRARHQMSQPPLEGAVRLGVAEDFNYAALPEVLTILRSRHPNFELFVRVGETRKLHDQLRTDALDMVLSKRQAGGTEGDFICRQKMVWVGKAEALAAGGEIVPLVLTPPDTVTRDLVIAALRGAGRRWSIRFEAPTIGALDAAVQAGMGVTAFGLGMIPPNLTRVTGSHSLPPLGEVDFVLGLNPSSEDPVVAAFANIVRQLIPLVVARLEEEQVAAFPAS